MVMAMLIVALVFMGCPNVPSGTIIVNGIDISTGLPYDEPSNGGENIESGEEVTVGDNGNGEEENNDGTEVTVDDNSGEENNENNSQENGENNGGENNDVTVDDNSGSTNNGGENNDVTVEDNSGENGENNGGSVEETHTEQLYTFGNQQITLTQFEQFLAENTWITEDDYRFIGDSYIMPMGNLYLCNDTDWVSLEKLKSMQNVWPRLERNTDYTYNSGNHTITLTENGLKKVDTKLNIVPRTYTLTVYNKANVKTVYSGDISETYYNRVCYGNVSVAKNDNNVETIFEYYNYYDKNIHMPYGSTYHENCQRSIYYTVRYNEIETFTYGPTTEDPRTLKWKIYGGHMGNYYDTEYKMLGIDYDLDTCKMFGDDGWYTMDFVADDYGENVDTSLYVYATADGVPENYSDYNIHLTTNLDEVETNEIIVPETHTF